MQLTQLFILLGIFQVAFAIVNAPDYPENVEKDEPFNRFLHFEFNHGTETIGQVTIGLFENIVPLTTENFEKLAPKYASTNTLMHRIIPNFVIQGGDFDGAGGHSIFGDKGMDPKRPYFSGLEDENFTLKHDRKGRVSVANIGQPDTGGSQFFICLEPQPGLDGKHVVWGQVVDGWDVVSIIAAAKTDDKDKPLVDVSIKKAWVDNEGPISTPEPISNPHESKPSIPNENLPHNDSSDHGATSIVLLPFGLLSIILIALAVKYRLKIMYLIRGPRYRRLNAGRTVSVNGEV